MKADYQKAFNLAEDLKKDVPKMKKKIKHRHRWESDGDSCMACGAYERSCKDCSTIQMLDSKGRVLDEGN